MADDDHSQMTLGIIFGVTTLLVAVLTLLVNILGLHARDAIGCVILKYITLFHTCSKNPNNVDLGAAIPLVQQAQGEQEGEITAQPPADQETPDGASSVLSSTSNN
ncbi:hypothetical protein EJ04DRAFT_125207 [Polyplosphaeria fusca]|uniref:Uncharacterized protein n=1 Tax=Polyplosphaeria fusca TaxID=682080 RepID=A0A9P4V5I2_9PLEO|nr:hypothetical protein EJ04DRAFT_125207 [Polyplosphaeria fusca]